MASSADFDGAEIVGRTTEWIISRATILDHSGTSLTLTELEGDDFMPMSYGTGYFHASAMRPLWRHVNDYLTRWLMRKYKHLARGRTKAARALGRLASASPKAFVHWEAGVISTAG